jgi:hypothetical protein
MALELDGEDLEAGRGEHRLEQPTTAEVAPRPWAAKAARSSVGSG